MAAIGRLSLRLPIVGAPMAGVSTPELAAAVSKAGGLGSIAIGASTLEAARQAIDETRRLVGALPFAVNVFCHPSPKIVEQTTERWLNSLREPFARFGRKPPTSLKAIYTSFDQDEPMVDMLISARVPVVSFHFGLPSQATLSRLKESGALLFATATNLAEAQAIEDAGLDAIVAQGYEAGGHRGMFDTKARDEAFGTLALTRLLAKKTSLPVIAAGGIMDGAGIAAALKLGAVAAQLGTALVACPESAASDAYRAALLRAKGTAMVDIISGRPARTILNRWTELLPGVGATQVPEYPVAYDAGKQLHAAAIKADEHGFGAQWAGQGVALARALPAGALMEALAEELSSC